MAARRDTIFLDTSYLIALELTSDQNHAAAQTHWRGLVPALPSLLTTSYVFDEVVTFFNGRGHHAKALQVGRALLASSHVQMLHVDVDLFQSGWEYLQNHQDKEYSLTDCISFVVMEQRGIYRAPAFDRHFGQAGFVREP
jgi:predicted nucleic acid-binding protein